MNQKIFSAKDWLKLLACICMLIDHIGLYFFPDIVILRIVGRLAFPIFAFFVAESFYYTSNKLKYLLRLLLFALISQLPMVLLQSKFELNILFTFIFALLIVVSVKKFFINKVVGKVSYILGTCVIVMCMCCALVCDYSLLGIGVVIAFYFGRNNNLTKFSIFAMLTIIYVAYNIIIYKTFANFLDYIQLFSLLLIPILWFYDNNKRYANYLKYFFYVFYPLHLFIIATIKLIA